MPDTPSGPASRLVYASTSTQPFDDQSVEELARLAAANNASIGVTGYLHFSRGRFVQCLEGERGVVAALLDRIERDPRHEVQARVWRRGNVGRRFPRWSMRRVRDWEMTEIGLEHILADQVLLSGRLGEEDAGLHNSIWRVIDTVAESLHDGRR